MKKIQGGGGAGGGREAKSDPKLVFLPFSQGCIISFF